jgi:hypothetical protein
MYKKYAKEREKNRKKDFGWKKSVGMKIKERGTQWKCKSGNLNLIGVLSYI